MNWTGPSILEVARASGREPRRVGSQFRVQCPDPKHADAHPSCDIDDDKNTFICRSCNAHGGVVAFANLAGVRLSALATAPYKTARTRPLAGQAGAHVSKKSVRVLADAPVLWNQSTSVLDDRDVASWLQSRGVDAADVDLMGVARALPASLYVPRWARSHGGFWPRTGHRLLLRLFNAHGVNVGIRARRICSPADDLPKSLSPSGLSTTGLLLANSLGHLLLSEGASGNQRVADLVRQVGVVIAEGDVDFLVWATRAADSDELAPVVFGIANRSWTDEIAGRIPDNTNVTIRAHDDQPGRLYARTIGRTLFSRCRVRVLEAR